MEVIGGGDGDGPAVDAMSASDALVQGGGGATDQSWVKRVIRAPWRYYRVKFSFEDAAVRMDASLCKTVSIALRYLQCAAF